MRVTTEMLDISLLVCPKEEVPEYLAELLPKSFSFGAMHVRDGSVVDAIGLTAAMLAVHPFGLIRLCRWTVGVGVDDGAVWVATCTTCGTRHVVVSCHRIQLGRGKPTTMAS